MAMACWNPWIYGNVHVTYGDIMNNRKYKHSSKMEEHKIFSNKQQNLVCQDNLIAN
jgi:hypothetical protein